MILLCVKLGFLQLICKGSLIFKSNLELALPIILKERELYNWRKPNVNAQQNHLVLTLSL